MGTQTLRAQVAATQLELERLDSRLTELEGIDRSLFARFQSAYKTTLAQRRAELDRLAQQDESPTETTWQGFAKVKAHCEELASESLDFMQGALFRRAGLDDGVCAIADTMLDGFEATSHIAWGRLSVPADSEFVTDLAQIVRIRSIDTSVWHLPVAAHEFGHFIGPQITVAGRRPFEEILARAGRGTVTWSYAHEYFADLFATWAIGPSFAAACIISRFDPADATLFEETHPAHTDRVYLMLRLLEVMDDETNDPQYVKLVPQLRAIWSANLAGAGRTTQLEQADVDRLEEEFANYQPILADGLPTLKYGGLDNAFPVAASIRDPSLPIRASTSIADVLNGAWITRIDNPIEDVAGLRARGLIALDIADQVRLSTLKHLARSRGNA